MRGVRIFELPKNLLNTQLESIQTRFGIVAREALFFTVCPSCNPPQSIRTIVQTPQAANGQNYTEGCDRVITDLQESTIYCAKLDHVFAHMKCGEQVSSQQ